jgi:indole-3-glycerol phosphate synthase/phosphoribosylanthranilate isomerase
MTLEDIVLYKRSLDDVKNSAVNEYKHSLSPSTRSLENALRQSGTSFICEIKPASPSMGLIRPHADVEAIAKIYAPFADAISVLADEKFFGGSLHNVQLVSKTVSVPVLCKDVIVAPWQIYEARKFGADAVLLMLSVLDDETYKQCASAAKSMQLDIISEVHDESELQRAVALGAKIIGINNRNLRNMSVDTAVTKRLLPLVPKNCLVISESGFSHHHQIQELAPLVNGFLVGTYLMRAVRIDLALRELIFGRVKICGLTNVADAQNAYDAGAYYGGLNFSTTSPRLVDVEMAEKIIKSVPLVMGGVFVNQPIDEVLSIAQRLSLNFVQLHGDEEKDYVRALRSDLPTECEIWQSVKVDDRIRWPEKIASDLLVLDRKSPHSFGGTGVAFDWHLLQGHDLSRVILAGGINETNVAIASSLAPFAIDIASGGESAPGQKSVEKLQQIFANLRGKSKEII